jgi:uncharacterized protein YycO
MKKKTAKKILKKFYFDVVISKYRENKKIKYATKKEYKKFFEERAYAIFKKIDFTENYEHYIHAYILIYVQQNPKLIEAYTTIYPEKLL